MASGAPFLNSLMWSHGREGGHRWDSSSLNTLANFWYCGGISTFLVYCPAWIARSVEVVRRVLWSSSCCRIRSFNSSRAVRRMVGRCRGIVGLIDRDDRECFFPNGGIFPYEPGF